MTPALATRLVPLLRRLDPERAHRLSITALRLGLAGAASRPDDPALRVRALGRSFTNPIGLAAGFDKDAVAVRGLRRLGHDRRLVGVPVRGDAGHAQHRHVLAMAVLAAAVLPAALLENDDLVEPVLRDDEGRHGGAGHERGADGGAGAAADGEHVGEGDDGAGLGFELLDLEDLAGRDAILFSACADDCEHEGSWPAVPARRAALFDVGRR